MNANNDKPRAMQPHQIADTVAVYLKRGDLEGIISMFHPECKIFFPPDEPPKLGLAGAREVFEEFAKIKPTLVSTVTGEVINGDVALLQGQWRFETDDGELIAEGASNEVAKKLEDGSWGYFIDCPIALPAPQIDN